MSPAAQDAARAKQIDSMLADEPWEDVARFAAYSAQIDSLGLIALAKPAVLRRYERLGSALR